MRYKQQLRELALQTLVYQSGRGDLLGIFRIFIHQETIDASLWHEHTYVELYGKTVKLLNMLLQQNGNVCSFQALGNFF